MKKLSNVQRGYIRFSAVMLVFFTVAVVGWEFVEAHNAKVAAIPPAIQSGTAVISTGGDDDGFAYIDYNFPGCAGLRALQCPVVTATLSDQVEAEYVFARALSTVRGTIVIKLDEPTGNPIMVNWQATMPTAEKVGEEVAP